MFDRHHEEPLIDLVVFASQACFDSPLSVFNMPPVPGRLQLLLLVAALLALLAPAPVYSHGSLTVPRSRNVIRPINGETWWKDHGNGFGSAIVKPLNGPGELRSSWKQCTLHILPWIHYMEQHAHMTCLDGL
jgi:hypothetical protein